MTIVSVAVMAHPARRAMVDDLLDTLDRRATVVWDRHNDEWDTARRAWEANDPDASHHLVIQDDAVVCRDLVAGVERALTHVPDGSPLCLYFGQQVPHRFHTNRLATRTGPATSWLAIDGLHWGVGIVLPVPLIAPMLATPDAHPYDQRISRWLRARGITTWYPWPSLIDHRDTPSLIRGHGRTPGRKAHRWLGDRSALDVDWSGEVIHAGALGKRTTPQPRPTRPRQPEVPHMSTFSDDLVIATNNATIRGDRAARIFRNKTIAHTGSWIVQNRPDLWRPLRIDFPTDEPEATETVEGDPDPSAEDLAAKPEPAVVRRWAKGEGLEVPARGRIPDEVVDQYKAAHEGV